MTNKIENDWKRSEIVGEVRKKGSSISELSRQAGMGRNSLPSVFKHPWPSAERLIADFIGCDPAVIWPSRYSKTSEFSGMRPLFKNDIGANRVINALSAIISDITISDADVKNYILENYNELIVNSVNNDHVKFIRNYLKIEFNRSYDSFCARREIVDN